MAQDFKILVLNPGSTSTKIALFNNMEKIFEETLRHNKSDLEKFESIIDQKDYRFEVIKKALNDNNVHFQDIDAIAARGGITRPIPSGTYIVDDAMLEELNGPSASKHASALAGLIGYDLKKKFNIPAYVVDPVVVDELQDVARISGIAGIEKISIFHALNQKAIAKNAAKDLNKKYEDCNFIVAHMGGGISVAAHHKGRVIDVNNAIDGEGPFTPERSGCIALNDVVEICFSNKYTKEEVKAFATKSGGVLSYLKTNDLREVEKMIENNDEHALLIYKAMAYQIAKEIGAMSVVLKGNVDEIILTGGLAYSEKFTQLIKEQVDFIAQVKRYPGEFELEALTMGVLRVLNNEEVAKRY